MRAPIFKIYREKTGSVEDINNQSMTISPKNLKFNFRSSHIDDDFSKSISQENSSSKRDDRNKKLYCLEDMFMLPAEKTKDNVY